MFGKNTFYARASDESLLEYSRNGDRTAFELLYDRYYARLARFACSFVDKTTAEDMVQEVFIKLIENPEKFDAGRKFSTWIYTVTGNLCKNVLRDEKNRARLLEEHGPDSYPSHVSQQHQVDHQSLQTRLRHVYAGLADKERGLFVLRFEHELSIKEIAEIMQIPEGSVKSGIYYLLKKLSQHLKDFNHGR